MEWNYGCELIATVLFGEYDMRAALAGNPEAFAL
jgi:hypothetical protein